MPVIDLSNAKRVYLGDAEAHRVYVGGSLAWEKDTAWRPSADPAFGWEHNAKTAPRVVGGQTFLDGASGSITLSAKDADPNSQPDYLTLADGMPAYGFAQGAKTVTPLAHTAALQFDKITVATLARVTSSGGLHSQTGFWTFSDYASGGAMTQDITLESGTIEGKAGRLRMVGAGAANGFISDNTLPDLQTWACYISEIDATTGGASHYANGVLIGTAKADWMLINPPLLNYYAVGARRGGDITMPMEWAATIRMNDISPTIRSNLVDYLRREWGTRMNAWPV